MTHYFFLISSDACLNYPFYKSWNCYNTLLFEEAVNITGVKLIPGRQFFCANKDMYDFSVSIIPEQMMLKNLLFVILLFFTCIPVCGAYLTVKPSAFMPVGDFSEMAGTGYGFFAAIDSIRDYNYRFGITTGYFYLPGEYESVTGMHKIENYHIIPVMFQAAYIFNLSRNSTVAPSVECGTALVQMVYTSRDVSTGLLTEKTSSGFEPIVIAGLNLDYKIDSRVFAGINCGYGFIYEDKGSLSFIQAGLALGRRF